MFRKMPFVLLAVIIGVVLLDSFISLPVKEMLYGLSVSIKSVIVFILPFIIFILLFRAAVHLASSATRVVLLILLGVCCSNFVSTFLSHYVGIAVYHSNLSILFNEEVTGLQPAWSLNLPPLISNDKAMLLGIILGILGGKLWPNAAHHLAKKLEPFIHRILASIALLIPIFVAGFVVKLQHDHLITLIVRDYTLIFIAVACAQLTYIGFLYLALSRFRMREFFTSIRNMLPAGIAGFCTMSSAAAMPVTIIGAEANAHNKDIARSVVPATVNIHLIGDCFAIPIFAYAVLKNFGLPEPSLIAYLTFTLYFVVAKFSVAAVPGGGILVMLPVLENYLGFTAPMLSLMTALYVLFDPVITFSNVLGNGAFAKLIDKILSLLRWKKH